MIAINVNIDPTTLKNIADYFGGRIQDLRGVVASVTESMSSQRKRPGPIAVTVEQLKAGSREVAVAAGVRRKRKQEATEVKVHGHFFPGHLLSPGWWEGSSVLKERISRFKDPYQRWLFHGFENWGPSWDLGRPSSELGGQPTLFGQLGCGDEADSVPVIVRGDLATKIRNDWLSEPDEQVFYAEITGCWYPRDAPPSLDGLNPTQRDLIPRIDGALLVDESHGHKVELKGRGRDVYSGYLWQCLAPEGSVRPGAAPRLEDVYFVWQHTNLAEPEAVQLDRKVLLYGRRLLAKRLGRPLELVQKSSAAVPGKPLCETAIFYNFVLGIGAADPARHR